MHQAVSGAGAPPPQALATGACAVLSRRISSWNEAFSLPAREMQTPDRVREARPSLTGRDLACGR